MLIDSHAHLDSEKLNGEDIISNMKKDGLDYIVDVGVSLERSLLVLKCAKENEGIYAVIGIHPEFTDVYTQNDLDEIEKLCEDPKVIAIGEIGLDYYENTNNKEKQKELLVAQLQIAHRHNLPIVIHNRDSIGDMIKILQENKELLSNGGVFHCFTGSKETAQILLKMGFYLSFSGVITFKSVNREVLEYIPLDRILVETDSPFLAPEPVRGTINEPKNVKYTALKIADYLDVKFEEFCKITSQNCKNIFKKLK